MKNKKTISLTEARKNIFLLADSVQNSGNYYTLTERGRPKAVLLSEEKFNSLRRDCKKGYSMVRDGDSSKYQPVHVRTLIIRDESKVVYLSDRDQERPYKEEELIRSQLYVELIEKYHYPFRLLEIGRYVKVGHPESRSYIEADVIANDLMGNVQMIFAVRSFDKFEESQDRVIADLFSLAYASTYVKKPRYLVYFSRRCRNREVKTKVMVVDYTKFNTFAAWKKANRPCVNEIPAYDML